jgi:hypothetical protein
MIETPVSASPAMSARSTGAAPRHRGSSDGCTFSSSYRDSSGSRISAPNAQTHSASGLASAIRASIASSCSCSGCATSSPSSRARTATGGGATRRPRPCGRSGRVTTSSGRCGPSASRESTAAAKSEVPR